MSASADTVSAALLRSVELISSFIEAARNLPSALSTECLNCAMVVAIVVAALLACAAGLGLRLRQPFALDHGVAEDDDGARHLADLVARLRRRNARRGVAVGEPLHHGGKAVAAAA